MRKFLDVLDKVLLALSGSLLAVMIASIAWQVLLRYGFHDANAWSEELARYCMVVIVMLTAPLGLKRGRHVRVDLFVGMMPPKVRKCVDIIIDLFIVAYMVGLFISAITLMSNPAKQFSPGLKINMMYIYASIALGCILMLLFMGELIYSKYILPLRGQNMEESA